MTVPPKNATDFINAVMPLFSTNTPSSIETEREPFLSAGSEQRMNYELHMPFERGHRLFSTPTCSSSTSPNKKRKKKQLKYHFLTESNVIVIDPTIKRM